MRIKYCFIVLFLFPFYTLFAQMDPQFSFFPWTQSYTNPGAMGERENHLNFTFVLRQGSMLMKDTTQTSQSGSTPTTPIPNPSGKDKRPPKNFILIDQQQVLLHIDSYIKQIKGAVGVTFLKDKVGIMDNVGFRLGYATRLKVRGGKLGIGLQLGFLNMKPNQTYLNYLQTDDPLDVILKQSDSFFDFDMNFGIHYKAPTWYVGVSGTQLLGGLRISGDKSVFNTTRQIYFSGGYIWNLNTAIPWSIEPHILLQTELKTWHLHLMALARYNGIVWFGLSYQLDNGISALVGATPFYNSTNDYLRGLDIGVSYSFDTKKTAYVKGGTWGDFELVVRYGFNFYKEKTLTGYGSTRHLYKNQY